MKLTSWAVFITSLVLAVVFLCDIGFRPASWNKVHLGESYVDLKKEYPDLRDVNHAKGIDKLIERRITGRWITFYIYKGDRICTRFLVYRIGTEENFKDINIAMEEVPGLWKP